jgi:hypothetical protein
MIKSNTKPDPIIQNIEGLTLIPTKDTEFESIKTKLKDIPVNNMQSINPDSAILPLREYCIKSSYNSASTGNYVNDEMVKLLLKRGCRLFDFEVLYKKVEDKFIPVVGFTTDNNYNIIESKNTIPLDDVLIMIATNAYTDTSPNSKDPLFINLRIKSNDSSAYNAIAKSIHNNIKSSLYSGKVTSNTVLTDLLQKTIIVVDKTIKRDYAALSKCDNIDTHCFDLNNYINMESGSEDLNLFRFSSLIGQAYVPLLVKDDNISTTASNIRMVIPDKIALSENPSMKDYVVKYGCQIIAYMFYMTDANLSKYEEFFNTTTSAFVPVSFAITTFSGN